MTSPRKSLKARTVCTAKAVRAVLAFSRMAVFNTDEEWVAACKAQIDTFGKGGGFKLATGCEYPSGADFTKARLMVEVAKTYNPYP